MFSSSLDSNSELRATERPGGGDKQAAEAANSGVGFGGPFTEEGRFSKNGLDAVRKNEPLDSALFEKFETADRTSVTEL